MPELSSPAHLSRRALLSWASAAALAPQLAWGAAPARGDAGAGHVRIGDARLSIQFDAQMRSRLVWLGSGAPLPLEGFVASESVVLADGRRIERFDMAAAQPSASGVDARTLTLTGRSREGLEKTVNVRMAEDWPGGVLVDVVFTNRSDRPLAIASWKALAHSIARSPARAKVGERLRTDEAPWAYSGATHADRRDWIQPVPRGFDQNNFMGMNASDYGGGTPVVSVWRRDLGLAIGHVEVLPRQIALPVQARGDRVHLAMTGELPLAPLDPLARPDAPRLLAPGQVLTLPTGLIALHTGDHFNALDAYRRHMATRGVVPAKPPASAFEPIWCAWGYEREFTVDRVLATLPKAKELGMGWAVLDDGWQKATGDWTLDAKKFPRGEADMKALVAQIKAHGMKARLWWAPLAVAPGSDELHGHTDTLLLGRDGEVQDITWWNSFYLCPAYEKTQARAEALVTQFIGDWGFEGLKIDGQHLNGVAPCYNPAHKHPRPEASCEALPAYFAGLHRAARKASPEALMEVCPCGTAYAFHTMPFIDQAPSSDPLSSWQVRHKGKSLKALMGPGSAYAGDHVELSDGGSDWASTIGIGAVPSTKFTWPVDPKPKDSFLLTPEREQQWRHWLEVYRTHRLAEGLYRGDLYDIAFDKPEAHAIEKDGRMHYAFYAKSFEGWLTLRGLNAGRYRIEDYDRRKVLGEVDAARPMLQTAFAGHLLLVARPV